jgi:hypothetical protein
VRSAQMLARSGGRACLQKAEIRHWGDTLGNLIFAEVSECSALDNVRGRRRQENYVSNLRANWIGDNEEFACTAGVASNTGKWVILRMILTTFHQTEEDGLDVFECYTLRDRSHTLRPSQMTGLHIPEAAETQLWRIRWVEKEFKFRIDDLWHHYRIIRTIHMNKKSIQYPWKIASSRKSNPGNVFDEMCFVASWSHRGAST